jgi:SAM-dependent methyltransferase
LLHINSNYSQIQYAVPWNKSTQIEKGSVDLFISHAVFEHVDDITSTYKAIFDYLKPGGIMSHQIDFKSHNTHSKWNGHWTYSDKKWTVIRGNKPFLINREPHSAHIRLIKNAGFELLCDNQIKRKSKINRTEIAPQFKYLTDDDLNTSGAFIQARKPISVYETTKIRQKTPKLIEHIEINQ